MKNWFEKLKGVKIPLPWAAFGAILMLLLGGVSGIVTDVFSQNKTAKIEAIQSFEDVAFNFESLGSEYFSAKVSNDPKLIIEKRDLMLKHILNQVTAAEKLSGYLNDDEAIEQYTEAMIKLRRAVLQDVPAEDMGSFWEATNNVLVSRDAITDPKS